jgi:hypothetical protein
MFRRRGMFQGNQLNDEQMAILVKANQLMSEGKPLEAGPLFTSVADAMKRSNHPRRAANLYARAAHAFSDGNDAQQALANARQALALFTQTKMAGRASMFFSNITRKMEVKGMTAAADELRGLYDMNSLAPSIEPRRRPHGLIPTTCPKCGAPVHGEDVSWVDDNTIECEYCGAMIRSE